MHLREQGEIRVLPPLQKVSSQRKQGASVFPWNVVKAAAYHVGEGVAPNRI